MNLERFIDWYGDKDIRDENSFFAKKMMDAGVSYVSNGKGRGAKSYFEKLM